MFEMITLIFSVSRDLAVSIIQFDITSGVSSKECLFVLTCNRYKSRLKSLLMGLVYSSISIVIVDGKWFTTTINFPLENNHEHLSPYSHLK